MQKINTPLENKQIRSLKIGDEVLLSGVIYTARDQAHKRLVEAIKKGRKLPIELKGAVIYYCGPTRTLPGKVIGSCGPTTSSRMDVFTPALLKAGVMLMIGKGDRSAQVACAIGRHKAAYLLAYAGCGALIAQYVKKAKLAAFGDLGPEAIFQLEVKGLPLIVGIDARGKNIYQRQIERNK